MAKPMKDSRVEWIGDIPEHWEIEQLGNLYKARSEKVSDYDYPPLSVTKMGIVPQLETAAKSDNHNDRKKVCIGDFVINSRSDRKMSSGTSIFEGSVSLINTVLYSKNNLPEFSNYLLKNSNFAEEFYRWGTGIVADLWSTNYERMKRIPVPYVPLSEQRKIAAMLDEKTAHIDSIITKTKESIEAFKTYKQALITETVTKGLNPDVKMKDSGIEWIGETPEHWNCSKMKYITNLSRGQFSHRPRNDERYYDGVYPFIQTGDVAKANKFITSYSQTLNELGKSVSKEFPKGTLVMTIAANVGDVAVLDFDSYFPDSVIGFVPKDGYYWNYLYYLFTAMKPSFVNTAIVSTQLNLNIERVKEMPVPITTDSREQQRIAAFLDEKTTHIDSLIANKEKMVQELEAYKKAMIYEYVTGKKEVE